MIGLNLLRLWDDRGSFADIAGPLSKLIADGDIKPVVAKVFPMEQAAEAHRFLQERQNVGKVVLRVS